MQIKQHSHPVIDYAIEFRTAASDSGWNTPALIDAFMNGLADPIKDCLAPLDLPQDLDTFISMATRVDNRLRERERGVEPHLDVQATRGVLLGTLRHGFRLHRHGRNPCSWEEPGFPQRKDGADYRREAFSTVDVRVTSMPHVWEKDKLTSYKEGAGEQIPLEIPSTHTYSGNTHR